MAVPDEKTIESTLRNVIAEIYKADELDNLTVKRIRQGAEKKLGLEAGWFKSDEEWNERSKEFILEEVSRQEQDKPASSQVGTTKAAETKKSEAKPRTKAEPITKRGEKRASTDPTAKPSKKQKLNKEDEDGKAKKTIASHPPKTESSRKKKSAVVVDSDDEDSDVDMDEDEDKGKQFSDAESSLSSLVDDKTPPKAKTKSKPHKAVKTPAKSPPKKLIETLPDDDSDLSSLIDDGPPAKRSKPTKSKTKPNTKQNAPKSKPKSKASVDTDTKPTSSNSAEDEIKSLQSWLLKCGIRKKWNQVLAPYDTSKEKIVFLKGMLKDIGMDGRFSASKARQIKEARELQAELDAVQEFAQDWGMESGRRKRSAQRRVVEESEDEDEDEGEMPKPEKAKVKEYDFADSGESD